jgi:hypothetical protein
MDSKQLKAGEQLERLVLREKPSQVPFHCVKASYQRMLMHARIFDPGPRALWACEKTASRINAKVTYRTIWNRDRTLNASHVPVAYLYCPACDEVPQVKGEDPIWADEVQTLSM